MSLNDIIFRFYSEVGIGPKDFRIILILLFSFMLVSFLFFVIRFYTRAYKALVESENPEMTEDKFLQLSKWPITIAVCWLLLAFAGYYAIVETTQWPSSHGHYVGTNIKSHSSGSNWSGAGQNTIP
ncbi:MAG: hypothetical protein ACYCVT_07205 [Acidithiobacillus ferrooxidans]|nr:hypothetical protein [Acidithiobacillus sp.]